MSLSDYIPKDKQKHILAGLGISYFSSKLLVAVTGLTLMTFSGVVVAAIAGVLKEAMWDKALGHGTYENADIGFTIFGGAMGNTLASLL